MRRVRYGKPVTSTGEPPRIVKTWTLPELSGATMSRMPSPSTSASFGLASTDEPRFIGKPGIRSRSTPFFSFVIDTTRRASPFTSPLS